MSRLAHGFATDAEHEAFQMRRAEAIELARQRELDNNPALARALGEHKDDAAELAAIVAKASSDPGTLTDADMARLPWDVVSPLMEAGSLAHLGIGARRQRR